MIGEVLEVLCVHGRQWQPERQATSSNPRVIDRTRSSALGCVTCDLTPRARNIIGAGQDGPRGDPLLEGAPTGGPQSRTTAHFVSSPSVTNVIPACVPTNWAASGVGNRFLMVSDATSVSRMTAVMLGQARSASRSARTAARNCSSSASRSNTPGAASSSIDLIVGASRNRSSTFIRNRPLRCALPSGLLVTITQLAAAMSSLPSEPTQFGA